VVALLRKVADGLTSLATVIAVAALLVEVAIILTDVTGRWFGAPLTGAQDISQMAMVILVFGAMALCDKIGGHVAVDLLESSFPDWLNWLAEIAGAVVGAVIFAGIAWTVYESSKLSQLLSLATNVIFLPKAYFQWALTAFAALTSATMALRAVETALGGARGRAGGVSGSAP
jgi:TRAP-type C4-dicarboxylate transport system permease small subunit